MKLLCFALSCALGVFSISSLANKSVLDPKLYLSRQEFMNVQTAKTRYGAKPIDVDLFRKASGAGHLAMAAAMAVTIIKTKHFIGKTPQEVKSLLGPPTGHFWNDTIPSYIIEEGWRTGQSTWQLVFLLDDLGRISEARIHKNCCRKDVGTEGIRGDYTP